MNPIFIHFPPTDGVERDCRIGVHITVGWMALVALQSQLKQILLYEGQGKETTEPGLEKDLRVIHVHMKN